MENKRSPPPDPLTVLFQRGKVLQSFALHQLDSNIPPCLSHPFPMEDWQCITAIVCGEGLV
jgi:hypothetical protein